MWSVSTQKPVIMFRVSREAIRDALKRAAQDDVRSVATLLEKITVDWLTTHGYLTKPGKAEMPSKRAKRGRSAR
jgi:hypothetical protein